MLLHDMLVAVALGLLCGVDGCVLAACAVGTSLRMHPVKLGLIALLGHMVVGALGVLGNSVVGTGGQGFAETVAVLALAYLAYRVINPHHAHAKMEHLSVVALALVLSIDAVPAGMALYGETLADQAPSIGPIVGALILNTVSALTVGTVTTIAASIYLRLSEMQWFSRTAPILAAAVITFLTVRAGWTAYGVVAHGARDESLTLLTGCTGALAAFAAAWLMWSRKPSECCAQAACTEHGESHRHSDEHAHREGCSHEHH